MVKMYFIMKVNRFVHKILGLMQTPMAVAGVCFMFQPVHSYESANYDINTAEDIEYYAANMPSADVIEFSIHNDIECSPVFSQGDLVFSSASYENPSSLKLTGSCFTAADNLELYQFKRLEIENKNEQGSAISGISGGVRIHQVSDNNEDTADVIFTNHSYNELICSQDSVYMSNNGDISASGHMGLAWPVSSTMSNNGVISAGGNLFTGRGIILARYIGFWQNEDISFDYAADGSIKAGSRGEDGQLYVNGTVQAYGNGNISFNDNRATQADSYNSVAGGAILASSVSFEENGNICFTDNSSHSSNQNVDLGCVSYGGAISAGGSGVSMVGNGDIDFCHNVARSGAVLASLYKSIEAKGGAIYGIVSMIGNGDISFRENAARADSYGNNYSYAMGGALVGGGDLIGNGDVTFASNSVTVEPSDYDYTSYARGGAIANYGGALSISDNGNVLFFQNRVKNSASVYDAVGGAIYGNNRGDLSICNNDSVLFERNTEVGMGTYRLRSIYMDASYTERSISLSAAAGKSIEFRDSIYIGQGNIVKLNACYVDSSGQSHEQKGDIIFTGATTQKDLYIVKGNEPGNPEEILASRTTEVNTLTNLYGGRLRVEDGAIYKGYGMMVHEGSEATVLVKDATLSHAGDDLTFSSGTTLAAEGVSHISGNVVMMEGSKLSLSVGAVNSGAAVLSLASAMDLQGVHLSVNGVEYLMSGKYQLIHDSAYADADWFTDVLSITGCASSNLAWENGVLTLTCSNSWNQAADDGSTISSITGNLVVMNGAEIVLNGELGANDSQQGKGDLIIDSGVVHLEQGANVAGDVVFTGTQQAERSLSAETGAALRRVVLATSQSETSSIEVSDNREVELECVTGTGNLSKEGSGTLKLTGTSTDVQGNLVVNEGKLLNTGSLVFAKIELNGGMLDNQGSISSVEINGGILSGSGVFGGLTMKAGRLVVGNSPGFQMYSEDLHAEGGELLFSVASVTDAATSSCVGWESTVYSNIDMGGNSLNIGENVTLTIAFGGETLTGLAESTMEQPLTISLHLVQNAGNHAFFTDELLARLEEQTEFIITSESEGLTAGTATLAGLSLMQYVSDVAYTYDAESGSLTLTASFATNGGLSIPEPATATLSLLALAALAARRRRK